MIDPKNGRYEQKNLCRIVAMLGNIRLGYYRHIKTNVFLVGDPTIMDVVEKPAHPS